MCGGCRACLAAQGYEEYPDCCPACGRELGEEDGDFCDAICEAKYLADLKAEDDALAAQLAEEAALAAEWKKARRVA